MGQKTKEELDKAFSGESKANRRYLAFAKRAEEEGLKNIAQLFRATAESETVHALNHQKILEGIGKTIENLNTAINGENYEHTIMYPDFIKTAARESETDAIKSYTLAKNVEKEHENLFKEALNNLKLKQDIGKKDYWICGTCGHLHENEAPETCPICGATSEKFKLLKK